MPDRVDEALAVAHDAIFTEHFNSVAACEALFRALQELHAAQLNHEADAEQVPEPASEE